MVVFKNVRCLFSALCVRNSHVTPLHIIMSTQSMMIIHKTIRTNANLIAILKFANKNTILDYINPMMNAFNTEEKFRFLYDCATVESHNALVIDATKGNSIFKKNFEVY